MDNVEMFLRDYWQARRSVARLIQELKEAQTAYELGAASLPSSGGMVRMGDRQYSGTSSVERAAMLLVDELGAEVKAIEKRLAQERQAMAYIEAMVGSAGLRKQEMEFIRLRYFENLGVEAVAQRMFCSLSTCWRLKKRAIAKIGAALSGAKMNGACGA